MERKFLFEWSDLDRSRPSKRKLKVVDTDSGISPKNIFSDVSCNSSMMLFDESLFSNASSDKKFKEANSTTPVLNITLRKRHERKKVNSVVRKWLYPDEEQADSMYDDTFNESGANEYSETQTLERVVSNKELSKINSPNTKKDETPMQLPLVVFDRTKETLSQHDVNWEWEQILRWKQPRRDVGLWIECCRKSCKKLRFVEEYHDPSDVPKIWYCEMNLDKSLASCDIPEEPIPPAIDDDLIENEYNAGSIVWARVHGLPWWPAIVNDCPDTFAYYMLPPNSQKPNKYYVTFIDEEDFSNMWMDRKKLKPFKTYSCNKLNKKTKFNGIEYKERLRKCYKLAQKALPLTILERLQRYSFLAKYDQFRKTNIETETQESQSEIPSSRPASQQFSIKDYYHNQISKKCKKGINIRELQ